MFYVASKSYVLISVWIYVILDPQSTFLNVSKKL